MKEEGRSEKYGITFIDGSRSYLEDCDVFTLAIHFPGERGCKNLLLKCSRNAFAKEAFAD